MIVIGEFNQWESLMSIGHPTINIVDPAKNDEVIEKDVANTVPDQIKILGTVGSSNVPVSLQWRGGRAFPGVPTAEWHIVGQKGVIRFTSSTWALNVISADRKIEVLDSATGEVEVLEVEPDEWDSLPVTARNIAKVYEAYRKGEWWPDWEWAIKRHEQLEDLWRSFDEGKVVK